MARIQYEDYVRLRARLEKAFDEQTAIEMSRKAIRAYIDHCLGDRHMYIVAKQCGVNLNIDNVSDDMRRLLTEERTNRLTLLEKIYKQAKLENLINSRGTYPNVAVAWGMIRGAVEVILDGHFQNEIKSEKAYLDTIEHVLFYGLFSGGNKGET